MFKEGSIWKPPLMNCYTTGMPDELIVDDDERMSTKGTLSNTYVFTRINIIRAYIKIKNAFDFRQRDRLEDLIRNLTPESKRIGEVMVFCIEHSEAAEEVTDCITESLSNEGTVIIKKIARLYLVSDILHNCAVKINKASFYRKA